uniref:NADH-ubiquinone oxidoreductase chain 6 n=1 Tax=Chalinolobus tuberculatus TaxID=143942 RepID=Q9G3R2_CHATU|nr:NADH dehydrogenase subunit 6 [Chalinolobus tuberculatus]AAG37937.1 NADH dehydrogenase subunit 6 [Chalinolobus tuberculatus]
MMVYIVLILSIIFVVGFVSFSSKPSPIYGGVGLIMSGAVGCSIVVSFGGSFLGLMVFLIYLGGMLVVFGYTTAMATEQYPEVWVSSLVVLGSFIVGLVVEVLLVVYVLISEKLSLASEFNKAGDWIIYNSDGVDVFSSEIMGVGALYSFGNWLVLVTGWSLLIGVVIILEITRGNK